MLWVDGESELENPTRLRQVSEPNGWVRESRILDTTKVSRHNGYLPSLRSLELRR